MGKPQSNKWFVAGLIALTGIVIGWISACNRQAETAVTDPTDPRYWTPERIALSRRIADAAAHGKVLIGMYAPDCEKAWGKPEKVNRTTTANGVSEWWWYADGRGLHFENRVVVAIHSRNHVPLNAYEIRPPKDSRGVNLISDALPFWSFVLRKPNAAQQCDWLRKVYSRSRDAAIRVYHDSGNVI